MEYSKATLKYATHSSGRLETLYFEDSGWTSRVRIDHPSGCYVQDWRQNVERCFFKNAVDAEKADDFLNGKVWRKIQVEEEFTKMFGSNWEKYPYQEWSQLEVTYDGPGNDGRVSFTHLSGGVISPLPDLSDNAIKAIVKICQKYAGKTISEVPRILEEIKEAEKLK